MLSTRWRACAPLIVVLGLVGGLTACRQPAPPPTGQPGQVTTTTLRYGPYTIPAAKGAEMGMIENAIAFGVARPCSNCYITSMQAGLITPEGATVNVAQGLWLHHMVLADQAKQDLTCAAKGPGLLGQRFFSSGNERSPVASGGPFGYQQGTNDAWNMIYDLMNMTSAARQVYITVTYQYVSTSTPGYRPMTPLWLDINQCANSERPPQSGSYNYGYSLTSQWTGSMIGIGGHLHDGGTNVTIAKNSVLVCDSRATYGGTPDYIEGSASTHMPGMAHISDMSRCHGTAALPVTTIAPGDRIDLVANYDADAHMQMGNHPVMGIAIGYLDLT
jgi:hypothetical protein